MKSPSSEDIFESYSQYFFTYLTTGVIIQVPKKSQFSLKRKKSKDDLDMGELVCPLHDDGSGDMPTSPVSCTNNTNVGVAC